MNWRLHYSPEKGVADVHHWTAQKATWEIERDLQSFIDWKYAWASMAGDVREQILLGIYSQILSIVKNSLPELRPDLARAAELDDLAEEEKRHREQLDAIAHRRQVLNDPKSSR